MKLKELKIASENYLSGKSNRVNLIIMHSDMEPTSVNCPKALIRRNQEKLDEIVDMLPEIKLALIMYASLLDENPSLKEEINAEDLPDNLREKIKQWENN